MCEHGELSFFGLSFYQSYCVMQIQEVTNKTQQKAFAKLPFTLYKGNPYWVPPIIKDELAFMSAKHPAREFCDAKFWIVSDDKGRTLGRIAAIVNHAYNKKMKAKIGRFARLEFVDSQEVYDMLMRTATQWLREQGMHTLLGPLGYTNLDNQGLLIEGFDYLASIASVYHLPYYKVYIEKDGFEKDNDWIEFRMKLSESVVSKAKRGAVLVQKRFGFRVQHFASNNELKPYVKDIFKIIDAAFDRLHYVSPFTDRLIEEYTKKYFAMINPSFVKMVWREDQIIAFVVAVPSLSKAMQKANGKLFPTGFLHLAKAMKKNDVIDFFLTGVAPKYEHSGAVVMLFDAIHDEMIKAGIEEMETTGVFEDNNHVITNWNNYEHIQHKRRRCYKKTID